jgi:hypothetical protein
MWNKRDWCFTLYSKGINSLSYYKVGPLFRSVFQPICKCRRLLRWASSPFSLLKAFLTPIVAPLNYIQNENWRLTLVKLNEQVHVHVRPKVEVETLLYIYTGANTSSKSYPTLNKWQTLLNRTRKLYAQNSSQKPRQHLVLDLCPLKSSSYFLSQVQQIGFLRLNKLNTHTRPYDAWPEVPSLPLGNTDTGWGARPEVEYDWSPHQ